MNRYGVMAANGMGFFAQFWRQSAKVLTPLGWKFVMAHGLALMGNQMV
jgi:hypothetical protein